MIKTNSIVNELTDRDLDKIGLKVAKAFKGEAASITIARDKSCDCLVILVYGYKDKLLSKILYNESTFKMVSIDKCTAKKEDVYDAITEYMCALFGEECLISDLFNA